MLDPRVPGQLPDSPLGSVLGRPSADTAVARHFAAVLARGPVLPDVDSVTALFRRPDAGRMWLADMLARGPGRMVFVGHCSAADPDGSADRAALHLADETPVTAGDLKAAGAMAALLKDTLKPNLVQTLEHTPAFVHGGPFANIAHGCNSLTATRLALKLGDYAVTEAGFGADLGAEKFLDIKCRMSNLKPSAVVIVATVRALKHHGGVSKDELSVENLAALKRGLPNLLRHVDNITNVFGLPAVVALNRFPSDTEAEIKMVENSCADMGVNVALTEVLEKGGQGGVTLAHEVVRLCEEPNNFMHCYPLDMSIENKLNAIVTKIYRGSGVVLTVPARKKIEQFEQQGFGHLPICMAKTQYSFSDDPLLLGAPQNFVVTVRNLRVSAGAGFIVALTGEIMTMPGLPRLPSAERIDVDNNGKISGLF